MTDTPLNQADARTVAALSRAIPLLIRRMSENGKWPGSIFVVTPALLREWFNMVRGPANPELQLRRLGDALWDDPERLLRITI